MSVTETNRDWIASSVQLQFRLGGENASREVRRNFSSFLKSFIRFSHSYMCEG